MKSRGTAVYGGLMKPGTLVKLVPFPADADDSFKKSSAKLLTEPGIPTKRPTDAGDFPVSMVGTVLESKTYVKVFVGSTIGWIAAEELDLAE